MISGATLVGRSAAWREAVLGWIFPEGCQLCRSEPAGPRDGYVGPGCQSRVRPLRFPFCHRCGLPLAGAITDPFDCSNCSTRELFFQTARAAVLAEGPVLEAIHRYKYSDARWFRPFLSRLLVDAAEPELRGRGWTLLIPVPLHPVKQRERGFNQAEVLGRPLADALGIPLRNDLVHRAEPTRTQTALSREGRAENVDHAFRAGSGRRRPFPWSPVQRPARLDGERVVIVDDVLTTGATANAVARVLRRLGAEEICVWSVARATLHGSAAPGSNRADQ